VGNQDIPEYNPTVPEFPKAFVVLQHVLPDGSRHWDLCLDQGQTLATWQLLADPADLASGHIATLPTRCIADHRRLYLSYEGSVSGDRGHVTRVDQGSYDLLEHRTDLWRIRLAGKVLIGTYEIAPVDDSQADWTLQRRGEY
jgi:hypothetical protein